MLILVSIGEVGQLAMDLSSLEPVFGNLYFLLLFTMSVFVLLNILLSVVMDLFNSVAEERKRSEEGGGGASPSFARAVLYFFLTTCAPQPPT